ncbi:MAG: hypothetical protein ACYYK0_08080 [Candidatus Eutrophobiaceae bacterium]
MLNNAVAAIQVGVEDFDDGDPKRLLSSMRNVVSGLLLLYKEMLHRLSPKTDKELLIKQNIKPVKVDGDIVFQGVGKKTADVYTIKARFNDLGIGLDREKTRFLDNVIEVRNNIEHYYTAVKPIEIEQLLAKAFVLIQDFTCRVLKENPKELFGDDCWEKLLAVSDVYESQKNLCIESYDLNDWKFDWVKESLCKLVCPECNSDLVKAVSDGHELPNINMQCASCSHEFSFKKVFVECFTEFMDTISHVTIKDGGESLNETCFECDKGTFLVEEGICVNCGYELDYTECEVCSESLGVDDQENSGLCSYHAWTLDKED